MIRGKKPPLALASASKVDKEIKKLGCNLGKQEEWIWNGDGRGGRRRRGRQCYGAEEQRRTWPKRTATQEATACVDKGCMQKWIITRA